MRRIGSTLLVILILLVSSLSPVVAAEQLTVEETAYRLSVASRVAFTIDDSVDVTKMVDDIGVAYASFDGYKHRIKYYYYVEQPNIYYIQVFMESTRQGETLQHVREVADVVKTIDGEREKIQYINDYLIGHVVYDYDAYMSSLQQEEETENLAPWSAEGALLDGVAVCEGYAGAFMLICEEAGIPCIKVTGYLNGIPHAWNKVYLASLNQWYHVDVTNNDTDQPQPADASPLFLLTDEQFKNRHYVWNEKVNAALRDIRYPYLVMNAVYDLNAKGIVVGRGDGDFALTDGLTRNELAALLVRLYPVEPATLNATSTFPDVAPWAESAVAYCQQIGLLGGYPDGTFRGEQIVTKQEWANIALRYAITSTNTYDWHSAENVAQNLGLISAGRSSQIHGVQATRADVFDSLDRILTMP